MRSRPLEYDRIPAARLTLAVGALRVELQAGRLGSAHVDVDATRSCARRSTSLTACSRGPPNWFNLLTLDRRVRHMLSAMTAAGSGVPAVDRARPAEDASEKETLAGLLDFLRATVVNKVAGLSDEQARTTSVSPSTLTPAGVVKHLAGVERFWFSIDFAGLDLAHPWTEANPHGGFRLEDGERLVDVVAGYQAECLRSREIVAGASLEDRRGARE